MGGNDDLIRRGDLIAAYDAAHKGPPGGARKLIEEAPAIDAIPVALLDEYENEPMLKTPIHLIKNIWQHERDKHIDGGENDETY